jgi:phosphoribosylglycinamide formyltransferase-1
VHFVDAGVDTGDIIAQREVAILPNDTPATLHARIQLAERELYPEVIGKLAAKNGAA